jgi:hypothetical protein
MKIKEATTIDELVELGNGGLSELLLEELLRRAYSLGFRAGKETDEDIF